MAQEWQQTGGTAHSSDHGDAPLASIRIVTDVPHEAKLEEQLPLPPQQQPHAQPQHDVPLQGQGQGQPAASKQTKAGTNRKELGYHAFLALYIVLAAGGIASFVLLAPRPAVLAVYWTLLGIHFYYTAGVLAEGVAAVIKELNPRPKLQFSDQYQLSRRYRVTVLIAAYLPNEQDLILETVAHWLTSINYRTPYHIVLAYNTPKPLPVEKQLAELAASQPHLTVMKVPNSTSKARNVNYALSQLPPADPQEFEIVSVMDADHLPHSDLYDHVLANFEKDPKLNVVQGRCVIRNVRDTWITRIIAVEFDMIYNLYHVGRTMVHGFGLFGGTNGHWQRQVLQTTTFKEDMLTEDIDSSIRATTAGYKVGYDNRIVSTELAPLDMTSYLKQRKRWAQGWLQVTLKRTWPAVKPSGVPSKWHRFCMFNLLVVREVSFHINLWLTAFVATQLGIKAVFSYLWVPPLATTFLTAIVLARLATQKVFAIFFYALLYVPYYGLQCYIVMYSHVLELFHVHEWKVTSRAGASMAQPVNIAAHLQARAELSGNTVPAAKTITSSASASADTATSSQDNSGELATVYVNPICTPAPAVHEIEDGETKQYRRQESGGTVAFAPTHPRSEAPGRRQSARQHIRDLLDRHLGFTSEEEAVLSSLGIAAKPPAALDSARGALGDPAPPRPQVPNSSLRMLGADAAARRIKLQPMHHYSRGPISA